MGNNDDTLSSIRSILNDRQTQLVPALLAIAKYAEKVDKAHSWATDLRCLRDIHRPGCRFEEMCNFDLTEPYVAVSWTWQHSMHEDQAHGKFFIIDAQGNERPSGVRDSILDRVTKYIRHHDIDIFWIDKECIDQAESSQKVRAINSMDIVYKNATKSVGLLSTPILTRGGQRLMRALMSGNFATMNPEGRYVLLPHVSLSQVSKMLTLLSSLAGDVWWSRAWTFQEEYVAALRMDLLIPIAHGYSATPGAIEGELCVNAAEFREQSTIFLLALSSGKTSEPRPAIYQRLLRVFSKYNVMSTDANGPRTPMSAQIFADVRRRNLTDAWDTLAITANACAYSIRLDKENLRQQSYSLSLSVLGQFLLNGELIWFDPGSDSMDKMADLDIASFLHNYQLWFHDLPVQERQLTFLKDCRLPDVQFCEEGLRTRGFLWTLPASETVHTADFELPRMPYGREKYLYINPWDALELKCLRDSMKQSYPILWKRLGDWIAGDRRLSRKALFYTDRMAWYLVQAIREGYILRIGYLNKEALGIFIPPRQAIFEPLHVFTTWQSRLLDTDGLDNFVSVEVEDTQSGLIRAKRWINGLVCYYGRRAESITFAWPPAWR